VALKGVLNDGLLFSTELAEPKCFFELFIQHLFSYRNRHKLIFGCYVSFLDSLISILDYFFGIKNSSRFEIKQKYPIHSKKVLQEESEAIYQLINAIDSEAFDSEASNQVSKKHELIAYDETKKGREIHSSSRPLESLWSLISACGWRIAPTFHLF
jgi:DUF438 domain-containing protein